MVFRVNEDIVWADYLKSLGFPSFRGAQISQWIYEKGAFSPESMTNIPKTLREELGKNIDWSLPQITEQLDGVDGSTKLLLKLKSGLSMESVILRYDGRTSLCVSSQVGCKLFVLR